jgi:hypothetical protein
LGIATQRAIFRAHAVPGLENQPNSSRSSSAGITGTGARGCDQPVGEATLSGTPDKETPESGDKEIQNADMPLILLDSLSAWLLVFLFDVRLHQS